MIPAPEIAVKPGSGADDLATTPPRRIDSQGMMNDALASVLTALLHPDRAPQPFRELQAVLAVEASNDGQEEILRSLNAAFLLSLCDDTHPHRQAARKHLEELRSDHRWEPTASFYLEAGEQMRTELTQAAGVAGQGPSPRGALEELARWVDQVTHVSQESRKAQKSSEASPADLAEKMWAAFCPEASGIRGQEAAQADSLRARRKVTIERAVPDPIQSPEREILFTSNVLLTVPFTGPSIDELPLPENPRKAVQAAAAEPQRFWYDHPIPIGVEPDKNEILYGLRGLDEAVADDKRRGALPGNAKLRVALSVSSTHAGLQAAALPYLRGEIERHGELAHLEIFAFTERATGRLVTEVLAPAAEHYLKEPEARALLSVLGVEGMYSRHYNFLKALSALWSVLIDPEVRATFKFDLDQVFPSDELLKETGRSAFDHLRTSLWGASGIDSRGDRVELGMIAGTLVNQRDISNSIFTPDARFPNRAPTPDEYFFLSALPQALSTEAEMTARYDTPELDGQRNCLQRVHVTGGTTGVRVDSLRRHRPFAPSFIGRAEDQAYLLAHFAGPEPRLAYLHLSGLVMRHDKESFAEEAMAAAQISKWVGDCERILCFSAYARLLEEGTARLKDRVDPFTGCFISRLPATVVCLRFAFRAAHLFATGASKNAAELISNGAERLRPALQLTARPDTTLASQLARERRGWALYYDTLEKLEDALRDGDPLATELREKAMQIVAECRIS